MALNISAHWLPPFPLELVGNGSTYSCPELTKIPATAGAYVFGRKFNKKFYPLYIGQAINLRSRISQHLKSENLMKGLREATNGSRFVTCCEVTFRRNHNHAAVLDVLEDALIAHALAEGHELLQVKGTRFPSHTIKFTGNRTSESIAPRYLMLRVSG